MNVQFMLTRLAVAVLAAIVLMLYGFVSEAHGLDANTIEGVGVELAHCGMAANVAYYEPGGWEEMLFNECVKILIKYLRFFDDEEFGILRAAMLAVHNRPSDETLLFWAEVMIGAGDHLLERSRLLALEERELRARQTRYERHIEPGLGSLAPTGWGLGLGTLVKINRRKRAHARRQRERGKPRHRPARSKRQRQNEALAREVTLTCPRHLTAREAQQAYWDEWERREAEWMREHRLMAGAKLLIR